MIKKECEFVGKFKPILRKPGEVIRSEDWNRMQEDILGDIQELEAKLQKLREYVDSMEQTETLLNMVSPVGTSYALNEVVPGEKTSYDSPVVGLITRQWVAPRGTEGVICRFGIAAKFESMDYWSGAENGDRKTLEITFEYIDGTSAVVNGLHVHERSKLRPKGSENPYIEYLLSPNENVWYRYKAKNPSPEKEVLTVTFRNTNPECIPRIGNVIHYSSRIRSGAVLQE
jgi:hypothetical protein